MAAHDLQDELRTERWCAGLRFAGTRPLAPAERATLVERVSRLHGLLVRMAVTAVVLLVWPLALAAVRAGDLPRDGGGIALVATIVAGWVIGIPILGVLGFDLWRTRRRHLGDLARGEMLVFEGSFAVGEELDDEQQRLVANGLLESGGEGPQRLEVLAASRTIPWRDDLGRDRFHAVWMYEVAEGPGYAMRVPLARDVAWSSADPDVRFLKRMLNASEQAEIRRHIRRLERPNVVTILMMTMLAVSLGVVGAFLPNGLGPVVRGAPALLLQIPLSLIALGGYLRDVRLAYKLRLDAHTGWALTMEREAEIVHLADGTTGEAIAYDAEPEVVREFLPHSHTVWSEAGKPARWRDLRLGV